MNEFSFSFYDCPLLLNLFEYTRPKERFFKCGSNIDVEAILVDIQGIRIDLQTRVGTNICSPFGFS